MVDLVGNIGADSPAGSLESSAMWTTASMLSKSPAVMCRMSFFKVEGAVATPLYKQPDV